MSIQSTVTSTIPMRFRNMIPSLTAAASKSDINFQLSAAIIKGSKFITTACPNLQKNSCKGNCGSLHAEANAILSHYKKDLSFSEKLGWCYQPRKGKRCKGEKL